MTEKINLLITHPFAESLRERISDVSDDIQTTWLPARRADEIPAEIWESTQALLTTRALPEEEQAPKLNWVQLLSAGIERVRDAAILRKDGLVVTTLSGGNTPQTAEHALAMILALGHRLPELFKQQRSGSWPTDKSERFTPAELRNATVGIVGYGSVGREVARLLQLLNVQVLATKVDLKQLAETGYNRPGLGDAKGEIPIRIYPAPALKSMFKECDFVVICAPLTTKSQGMIGKDQLEALKPGAFLVDVSAGGVVDDDALISMLQGQKLAGAALEVFPEEPLAADSPLWEMSNVIISPHTADLSPHFERRALDLFCKNLQLYLNHEPLLNQVDWERGY
jgi:phosphoglycerate dehydrogenase-like enzyme